MSDLRSPLNIMEKVRKFALQQFKTWKLLPEECPLGKLANTSFRINASVCLHTELSTTPAPNSMIVSFRYTCGST